MTDRRGWMTWGLLLVPYLWLVNRFWFVCDDAYISFRFARNLAGGHGARYNVGDQLPVEGYSNFLWMLIAAVAEFVGADPAWWLPSLSTACGGLLIGLVLHTLRADLGLSLRIAGVSTLSLAMTPGFAVWSSGGLETVPQALMMFVVWRGLAFSSGRRGLVVAGLAGVALSLLRTEGIGWALLVGAAGVWSRWRTGRSVRGVAQLYLGLVLPLWGLYFGLRFGYYQRIFAHTVYAKVDPSMETVARGARYVGLYVITFLTPLLALPAVGLGLRSPALGAAGVLAAGFSYAALVSGDFMAFFRILVPMAPFLTLVTAGLWAEVETRWVHRGVGLAGLAAGLGALPAWGLHLVPADGRAAWVYPESDGAFADEVVKWEQMAGNGAEWGLKGELLRQATRPDDVLVAGAIGYIGYFSERWILDRHGLIEPSVVRKNPRDRLRKPGHDLLMAREFFLRGGRKVKPTVLESRVVHEEAGIDAAIASMRPESVAQAFEVEVSAFDVDGEQVWLVLLRRR